MKTYKWLQRIAIAALVVGIAAFAVPAIAASLAVNNDVEGVNVFHAGDTIHYVETVTNTNPNPAELLVTFRFPDGSSTVLDDTREWPVGEAQTYRRDYVVKGTESGSANADGLVIRSEITAWGTELNPEAFPDPGDIDFQLGKTSLLLKPAISVSAEVDFNGDGVFSETETYYSGSPAQWRMLVTNTGNCPVTVTMTDSLGHDYGVAFVLAKGASATIPYTSASLVSTTANTVSVVAVDQLGGEAGTARAQDTATAIVISPALSVETSVDFDGDGTYSPNTESGYAGDEADWKIVVRNTGTDPLTNVTVTDGFGGTFGPIEVLNPGQSQTFLYSTVINETTNNDATGVGTDAIGGEVRNTDGASAVISGRRIADLRITKSADKTATDAGGVVTYTLRIENVGNAVAEGYVVSDDFDERYMDVMDAAGGTVNAGKITWSGRAPIAAGGSATIVYRLKAKADDVLPSGLTAVNNVVVVTLQSDPNPQDNTAKYTVNVDNPFLPFTPTVPAARTGEPYLPYTGANGLLMFALAAIAAGAGLKLRAVTREEQ